MLTSVEFQGKDIEEAINNAAKSLGVSPEHIKFTVITVGSRGFLGIGRRKARIAVLPDENLRDKVSQGAEKKVPNKNNGPRNVKRQDKNLKKQTKREAVEWDWAHVPSLPTVPGEGECWLEGDDELTNKARETMADLIKRMGFAAEIKAGRIGNRIVLTLESEDSARLIGRRGSTLEALSLLMDRIMRRSLANDAENNVIIVVDISGYRARRHSWLLDSLAAAATEVRRGKKSQQISGLTPQEARMAYHALKPSKDIYIKFTNAGGVKNLILSPHYHRRESSDRK